MKEKNQKYKTDIIDEILNATNYYFREAEKCAGNKAYFSACVMVGAALEACLIAIMIAYKKSNRIQNNQILSLSLDELIAALHSSGWLPKNVRLPENIAREIQNIRNRIHTKNFIDVETSYEQEYHYVYGNYIKIAQQLEKRL